MNIINKLKLKTKEKKALRELKRKIIGKFTDAKVILYGSKARKDAEEFSDIDILVVLTRKISNAVEEKIFDMAYDIELKYDVVFGVLVESKRFWDSELANAMPIHWNIDREGVSV